jgi:hypothetical protein
MNLSAMRDQVDRLRDLAYGTDKEAAIKKSGNCRHLPLVHKLTSSPGQILIAGKNDVAVLLGGQRYCCSRLLNSHPCRGTPALFLGFSVLCSPRLSLEGASRWKQNKKHQAKG